MVSRQTEGVKVPFDKVYDLLLDTHRQVSTLSERLNNHITNTGQLEQRIAKLESIYTRITTYIVTTLIGSVLGIIFLLAQRGILP